MNRKSSVIWDYFTMVENNKAKCGFCKVILKVNQSSTTNLLRHMNTKHPTTDLSKRSRPNIELELEDNNSDNPSSHHETPSTSTSCNRK